MSCLTRIIRPMAQERNNNSGMRHEVPDNTEPDTQGADRDDDWQSIGFRVDHCDLYSQINSS